MPNVLTIREAVQRAKADGIPVSEYALRQWVKSGAVPVRKIGQKVLLYYPTVSADAETTVTLCGKNILPHAIVITTVQGITATQDADGTIHLNGTATANAWFYIIPAFTLPIAEYVLSVHNANFSAGVDSFGYKYKSNTHNVTSLDVAIAGLRSYTTYQIEHIEFRVPQGTTLNDATFQIQLEHGTTRTDYEVYKGETHILTAGQTVEVDSICPTMIASSSNGANITLGYHKSLGMQTEYDRFWDGYQENGNKVLCQSAYAYRGWNDTTYNPKHIDKPTNANRMFYESRITVVKNADFSNCTDEDELFRNSKVEDAGVVDTSKTSLLYYTFYNAQALHTLTLILKGDGTQTFNNPFSKNYALTKLLVEGTIGKNGLNFTDALLTYDSLMSVINALQYYEKIWVKTTEVADTSSCTNLVANDIGLFTTTGEPIFDVYDGYDGDPMIGPCCLVDGVYYIVKEQAARTLTLGTTNLAKLTNAEKAIATQKGWTLV